MKLAYALLYFFIYSCASAQQVPPAEVQVRLALLAAPEDKKEGAAVYGYEANQQLTLLRKGSNEMICISDDPRQRGLSVSCYHKDLEPFMKRGRDLRKDGKNTGEIFSIREQEVKSGKLPMPKDATTLFVFTADSADYNTSTGNVTNGYLRYVVYVPFATASSTGLPLKPDAPGMPWLMHPGTHGAHIMISPSRTSQQKPPAQ
jgi:hypothetical protein